MSSVEELEDKFQGNLVPAVSKSKYEQEWDKYLKLVEEFRFTVGTSSLKPYVYRLHDNSRYSYAASAIISRVSMLKKMNVVEGNSIRDEAWSSLNAFTKNPTRQ